MKKIIAGGIAAVLILLSPGLPCYQALAGVFGPTEGGKAHSSANPGAETGGLHSGAGSTGAQTGPAALVPLNFASGAAAPSAPEAAPNAELMGASIHAAESRRAGGSNAVETALDESVGPAAPETSAEDHAVVSVSGRKVSSPLVRGVASGDMKQALGDPKKNPWGILGGLFDFSRWRGKEAGAVLEVQGQSIVGSGLAASAASPAEVGRRSIPLPAMAKLGEKASVFDFSRYTPSQRALLAGWLIVVVGMTIYTTALPLLVTSVTGKAALIGTARLVHFWSFGFASLFAGDAVSRSSMKGMLVKTGAARSGIFGSLGILAMALGTGMPLPLFWGLLILNGAVVAHNHLVDMDSSGGRKAFPDKKIREQALYQYKFFKYALYLTAPPLFGLLAVALDAHFGVGTGAKAGFMIVSACFGAAVWIYSRYLNLAHDQENFGSGRPSEPVGSVRAQIAGWIGGAWQVLIGTPRRLARASRALLDNSIAVVRFVSTIWQNFIDDSWNMVVVPVLAMVVWHANPFGLGVAVAAAFLGGMLASQVLLKRAIKMEQKDGGEYRLIAALSVLAALAFIPSIGFWAVPVMSVGVPLILLVRFMLDPIESKMQSLLQTAIDEDPRAKAEEDNIWSLVSMFEVGAAGAGGYFFEKLFDHSGPGSALDAVLGAYAPLKVLTIALFLSALVYLGSLPFLKKPHRQIFEGRDFVAKIEAAKQALEDSAAELSGIESELEAALKRLSVVRNPNARMRGLIASVEWARELAVQRENARAIQALDEILRLSKPNAAEALARTRLEAARRAFSRSDVRSFENELAAALDRLEAFGSQDDKTRGFIRAVKDLRALAPRGRGVRAAVRESLDQIITAMSPIDETLALTKLKTYLKGMGLPPYTTEYDESPADGNQLVIGFLSQATLGKFGAIGQEIERQSPGSVHFMLDPSWVIHETDHDGKARNYAAKALTYKDGKPVIVEYKHPRLIRYFANFFTKGGNDRDDGVPLEKGIETPMSSSLQLDHNIDDKLLTRLQLAAKGIGVPATLALLMAAHPLKTTAASSADLNSKVRVEALAGSRDAVQRSIEEFLRRYDGPEVVVKPSGPEFHSGRGVKIFARDQIGAMADHAMALKDDAGMTSDGAILVEERISPPPLYLRISEYTGHGDFGFIDRKRVSVKILSPAEIETAQPWEKKDWNFRIWAERTPWDGVEASGLVARAGTWGKPTNANPDNPNDNAVVIPFELVVKALRRQHGLLISDEAVESFRADRLEQAGAAFQAIIAEEAKRVRRDGEPYRAQTDMIGFDDMEAFRDGSLRETIIEANNHDAGMQEEFDGFYPERKGEHSRARVATMLARARREAMRGRRLVIVGAGSRMKRSFLEKARKWGIEIVLVDNGLTGWAKLLDRIRVATGFDSKDNWARSLVSEFLVVDTTRPLAEAREEAVRKLRDSQRKSGKPYSIYTYWEDNPVLTAYVAEDMGWSYHSVKTAQTARSKSATRRATFHVSPVSFLEIKSRADLERAVKDPKFQFPAVIKYDHGAEGHYNKAVTRESALDDYDKIVADMAKSDNPIYLQGNEFVLEWKIPGKEWDANGGMLDGKLIYGSVTDNTPVRENVDNDGYYSMKGTGANLPSLELSEAQQAQILNFVAQALRAIGFRKGHFHVEGKTDVSGDHWLLEINIREGGSYVVSWDLEVTGIDEAEMSFAMALGIPPVPYQSPKPLSYNVGRRLFTDREGTVKRLELNEAAANAGITALFEKKPGDKVDFKESDRLVTLFVKRKTGEERDRALHLLEGDLMRWVNFEVDPVANRP